MGEVTGQVPPFASPAEPAIGTFWPFLRVRRVPSVFGVIRKLLSAHARGAMPRYAAAVVGAALVYGLEQLLTDDLARSAVADFAWTAAAIGAIFGTARAAHAARGGDRLVWLLFCAGSVSWLAGQLVRDATDVGGAPMTSALGADLGFMTAARSGRSRSPLLASTPASAPTRSFSTSGVSDVVASVTLFLSTTLAADVARDPQATAVAVLYPLLYVAATAAALSAVWALPAREPRGAVTSLFLGLGLNALAFVLYLPANIAGTFKAGTPLDALWIVGIGAIGIAGAQWVEDREDGRNSRLSGAGIHLSRMVLPSLVARRLVPPFFTALKKVPGRSPPYDAAVARVLVLATRADSPCTTGSSRNASGSGRAEHCGS